MDDFKLTDEQIHELGRKSREGVRHLSVRDFDDWAVFSKTFGWFKWKQKLGLSEAQVEIFRQGFTGVDRSNTA